MMGGEKGRSAARALREDVYGPFLEAVPDGIVIVDVEGRIVHVNPRLEEMSLYRQVELVGRPVEMLVPERFPGHQAQRRAYVEGNPVPREMGIQLDIHLRRRDGSEFPADIALSPITVDGETMVIAAVRDATERRRAERRLEAMLRVAEVALRGDDLDRVLVLIARSVRELVQGALATISLIDQESEDSYLVRAADGYQSDRLVGSRYQREGSFVATVISGGDLVVRDHPADEVGIEPLALLGPAAYVPLRGTGTDGVLMVAGPPGAAPFSEDALRAAQLLASQTSLVLEYARLRDNLSQLALMADRERIGRELHDGAIQALFAVGMSLQATAAMQEGTPTSERLNAAIGQIDEVIRDLRRYIFGLRPNLLARASLEDALRQLASELESEHGVTTVVEVEPGVAAALDDRAGDIVQLAREALSNVGRHAEAMTCRVTLYRSDRIAVLEIEDDGKGFDPEEIAEPGMGLQNLRDRAARIRGAVGVSTAPGEGATVRFEIAI